MDAVHVEVELQLVALELPEADVVVREEVEFCAGEIRPLLIEQFGVSERIAQRDRVADVVVHDERRGVDLDLVRARQCLRGLEFVELPARASGNLRLAVESPAAGREARYGVSFRDADLPTVAVRV